MSEFNNLFDEFMLNSNNINKSNDLLKKNTEGDFFKNINENLGEPYKIEFYDKDNIYYKKQYWKNDIGQIIKTIMSKTPFPESKVKKTRTPLEIQLGLAVKEENYELAVKLRDRIAKRDLKKTIKKNES
ncbi:MAG: hypothetical protein QG594_2264 [Bacteroidota bacterium]|nr:hypothetical protein [Bacteroidota bacterium]